MKLWDCRNFKIYNQHFILTILLSLSFSFFFLTQSFSSEIKNFNITNCDDRYCDLEDPIKNNDQNINLQIDKKKIREYENLYKNLRVLDRILQDRKFVRSARVRLLMSLGSDPNNGKWEFHGSDVIRHLYIANEYGLSTSKISNTGWDDPSKILEQYGWWGRKLYHPVTGKKLPHIDPVAMAKTVPSCYRNANPALADFG
jgi:hypothetical protein